MPSGPATCPGDPYSPGPVGAPFLGTSWGKFCWEQIWTNEKRSPRSKIHQWNADYMSRQREIVRSFRADGPWIPVEFKNTFPTGWPAGKTCSWNGWVSVVKFFGSTRTSQFGALETIECETKTLVVFLICSNQKSDSLWNYDWLRSWWLLAGMNC